MYWIVLFNAHHGPDGKALAGAIDPLMHRAAAAVEDWPRRDLFPHYVPTQTPGMREGG